MARIFLSSRFRNFRSLKERVHEGLDGRPDLELVDLHDGQADTRGALQRSLEELASCDLMVLLLDDTYGEVVEREYDRACELDIPVLAYARIPDGQGDARANAFRDKVRARVIGLLSWSGLTEDRRDAERICAGIEDRFVWVEDDRSSTRGPAQRLLRDLKRLGLQGLATFDATSLGRARSDRLEYRRFAAEDLERGRLAGAYGQLGKALAGRDWASAYMYARIAELRGIRSEVEPARRALSEGLDFVDMQELAPCHGSRGPVDFATIKRERVAASHVTLARLARRAADHPAALEHAETALKAVPYSETAKVERILATVAMGDRTAAEKHFLDLLDVYPETAVRALGLLELPERSRLEESGAAHVRRAQLEARRAWSLHPVVEGREPPRARLREAISVYRAEADAARAEVAAMLSGLTSLVPRTGDDEVLELARERHGATAVWRSRLAEEARAWEVLGRAGGSDGQPVREGPEVDEWLAARHAEGAQALQDADQAAARSDQVVARLHAASWAPLAIGDHGPLWRRARRLFVWGSASGILIAGVLYLVRLVATPDQDLLWWPFLSLGGLFAGGSLVAAGGREIRRRAAERRRLIGHAALESAAVTQRALDSIIRARQDTHSARRLVTNAEDRWRLARSKASAVTRASGLVFLSGFVDYEEQPRELDDLPVVARAVRTVLDRFHRAYIGRPRWTDESTRSDRSAYATRLYGQPTAAHRVGSPGPRFLLRLDGGSASELGWFDGRLGPELARLEQVLGRLLHTDPAGTTCGWCGAAVPGASACPSCGNAPGTPAGSAGATAVPASPAAPAGTARRPRLDWRRPASIAAAGLGLAGGVLALSAWVGMAGNAVPPLMAASQTVAPTVSGKPCAGVFDGALPRVAVGSGQTTCRFAVNVRAAYLRAAGSSRVARWVVAYSPALERRVRMRCSGAEHVVCKGGKKAVVILYDPRMTDVHP